MFSHTCKYHLTDFSHAFIHHSHKSGHIETPFRPFKQTSNRLCSRTIHIPTTCGACQSLSTAHGPTFATISTAVIQRVSSGRPTRPPTAISLYPLISLFRLLLLPLLPLKLSPGILLGHGGDPKERQWRTAARWGSHHLSPGLGWWSEQPAHQFVIRDVTGGGRSRLVLTFAERNCLAKLAHASLAGLAYLRGAGGAQLPDQLDAMQAR